MEQANKELREIIKKSGVRHWQVAAALGVSHWTFSNHLRFELSEEMKNKAIDAVKRISKEMEVNT